MKAAHAQRDGFNGQTRSRAANLAGDNAMLRLEIERLKAQIKSSAVEAKP